MRHFKSILAVAILAMVSCQSSDDKSPLDDNGPVINSRNLEGVWMLESIEGIELGEDQYMYIELEREDLTYNMYENFNSQYSTQTVGEFFLSSDSEDNVYIDGNYSANFGEKWREHYYIEDFTLESMTWRGAESGDVQHFVQVDEIPADIVAGTRSK